MVVTDLRLGIITNFNDLIRITTLVAVVVFVPEQPIRAEFPALADLPGKPKLVTDLNVLGVQTVSQVIH